MTTVKAITTDVMEYKKHIGYFWTLALYAKHNDNAKPNKKHIVTHVVFGKKERGVVLDVSHGTPPGVVEIAAVSSSGSSKEAVLAESENMDTEESRSEWGA